MGCSGLNASLRDWKTDTALIVAMRAAGAAYYGAGIRLDGMEDSFSTVKGALRRRALARRRLTGLEERREAGESLARRFPAQLLAPGATVAAYVSMGSEIETRPLLEWLLAQGCRVLVPRLGSGLEIGWSALGSVDALRPADGIASADSGKQHHRPDEPKADVLPPEALGEADLIIAPALAVDMHGVRLGRGAGWYDQALSWRKTGCPLIAVCWPWEVSESNLPSEPHDVPADGVLTPEGYRRFR